MTLPGSANLIILILLLIPVWGSIDAALTPDSRWRMADQSKVTWVLLQLLGILAFGVGGLIAAAFYFLRIKPQLRGSFDRSSR